MDKNAIKKYAVWARRELISRVSQKALQYGISEKEIVPASAASVNGVVLSAEEIKQRKALIAQIRAKGYEQVMEEVAYTWFNRFIALRFMEVNGYLPSHVRVFTDEDNVFRPQIITEAINLELDGLDMDKVYAWKDANDNDSLFKYLIITQCNALSPILPRMFQRIADYTELLFPDNLLREGSVIQQMIELIPEDDWKDAVQIIGWLYQYYNTEPKAKADQDVKNGGKITGDNLPEKTQIFTPDWIVRYMVENSLGRLWLEHLAVSGEGYHYCYDENGNNVASSVVTSASVQKLKSNWKHYLDEAEQEPDVQVQLAAVRQEYASMAPEQIKCIDPCAGSGHILAYMFDVLVQIYEDYGYSAREAVRCIIENNLYGLDIDERAAQLAYFSVMMKARQYDRRFFARKDENGNPDVPQPHVYVIVESNSIDRFALDYFINGDATLKKAMDSIIREMQDAKEYGSILKITPVDFGALYARFDEVRDDIDMSRDVVMNSILPLVQVAEMLAQKYDIAITNPPYLGLRSIGAKTLDYIERNYPNSKNDFFAVFMDRCIDFTKARGKVGLVTAESWLSLSSFERIRGRVLEETTLCNMLHLGDGAFDAGFGTAAFVLNRKRIQKYAGCYYRLIDFETGVEKEEAVLSHNSKVRYFAKQDDFYNIPGAAVSYWVSDKLFASFGKYAALGSIAEPRQGLTTCDNDRFMRFWHEVELSHICFDCTSTEESETLPQKWFPYNKGGEPRKWYGNNEYVVNWQYNGSEVKAFVASKYVSYSRTVKNIPYYFRKGLTWSAIAKRYAVRAYDRGFIFADKGQAIFADDCLYYYLCGLMNSKFADAILEIISPTLDFNCGYIKKIPIAIAEAKKQQIKDVVEQNISCSKDDWDSFETSWDFKCHPLVALRLSGAYAWGDAAPATKLASANKAWELLCEGRFNKLKENEEELNRIFIDIYGLQDELTPEVEDKDVTVRLADKKRDIKSLISYAVGCMFGRYSLDVPGLAYAGGEWDDSKYTTFKADKDSIIPICDDEYFADDIVGRFIRFIEVVYGKDTLQENLRFIADALGGSGQPKEVIRNYFLNDFYADHLKVYQKRPIYWLFDSGKKNGFKALVYMHRYQPDTIARMRTDYVHEQQARYRTAIADLEQRIASASTAERVKLSKRLKQLQEQATEIQGYEEKIHHLADQYISIDLDDGVKKNYAIFGDVLAKIK